MTEQQTPEAEVEDVVDEVVEPVTEPDDDNTDPEVFPRKYVENLRDENAKYRQRAEDRDDLATRLHNAIVAATGRLQDATDLAFDETHLTDSDALTTAIDALLQAKPHLGSRRPVGDIGQGVTPTSDTFSLGAILRGNAS